jgi:hypothetical protein
MTGEIASDKQLLEVSQEMWPKSEGTDPQGTIASGQEGEAPDSGREGCDEVPGPAVSRSLHKDEAELVL